MRPRRNERVGLFGGSFDPIHLGHITLAGAAVEAAGLDRVLFMPTAVPPHKDERALTAFETRAAMVSLAIAGDTRFELSREESGPEVSYTYRTVLSFADRGYGKDRLHLLIGSDSLIEMRSWREPEKIFARATIVVLVRPGFETIPPLPEEAAVICVTSTRSEISSTEIRRLAREGRSIAGLVPEAVERFIVRQGLYRGEA